MAALSYTLGAFALILVLVRFKVPLAAAIFLGTIAIGVLFGLGPVEIAQYVGLGTIQLRTLGLIAITVALLALSGTMQAGGQMEQIVSLAKAFFRRPAVTLAALPALIGLLPMPGGALFSAPMVASAAGETKIPSARLSAINYWFRHIWEHWWPLYPGVILAVTLTETDFGTFVAFQLPMGICMLAAGLPILYKAHPDLAIVTPPAPAGTRRKLLRCTSPIWIIIVVWLAVAGVARLLPASAGESAHLAGVIKLASITLGLIASLIWTSRRSRLGRSQLRKIWAGRNIWMMSLLVASVMVFQYMLGQVGAAGRIGKELQALHVPVVLVVIALPFVAGVVTGLAIGFVGASFPIVLGLVAALGGEVTIWPYVVLAYAFGHIGMMLSPLHLCHVMSNRYFQTTFGPVYRYTIVPTVLMAVMAGAYAAILKYWLG